MLARGSPLFPADTIQQIRRPRPGVDASEPVSSLSGAGDLDLSKGPPFNVA
jgi:hypothetical protein